MKRLVIVAMMVLMGVSPALAGSWDGIFGPYGGCSYGGYGGGGNILAQAVQWQIANRRENREDRKLDIAERYVEKMGQQNEQQSQGAVYGVVVRDQSREIQQLRLENKNLREENTELKSQLEEMRKEIAEMKQAFQELVKKHK